MYKVVPFAISLRRLIPVAVLFSGVFSAAQLTAATSTVLVASFSFTPSNSVINVGDTITWKNNALISHDSTQNGTPPLWQTGPIAAGGSASFTFNTPGFFPYHCATHAVTAPQQRGNVTVNGVNTPPTVSLTSPTNNQHFFAPATFTLQANATDNVAVASVEFFSGANSLGSDSSNPYSLTVSNLGQNSYSFSAQAVDNQGARATSAVVTVFVDNVPSVFIENAQMSNNVFSFRIRGGSAGQRCDIQKSTTLNGDWTTIGSAVFPATACPICPFIDFTDQNPAPDRRFYKIQVFP